MTLPGETIGSGAAPRCEDCERIPSSTSTSAEPATTSARSAAAAHTAASPATTATASWPRPTSTTVATGVSRPAASCSTTRSRGSDTVSPCPRQPSRTRPSGRAPPSFSQYSNGRVSTKHRRHRRTGTHTARAFIFGTRSARGVLSAGVQKAPGLASAPSSGSSGHGTRLFALLDSNHAHRAAQVGHARPRPPPMASTRRADRAGAIRRAERGAGTAR